jgi:hypothetical protein
MNPLCSAEKIHWDDDFWWILLRACRAFPSEGEVYRRIGNLIASVSWIELPGLLQEAAHLCFRLMHTYVFTLTRKLTKLECGLWPLEILSIPTPLRITHLSCLVRNQKDIAQFQKFKSLQSLEITEVHTRLHPDLNWEFLAELKELKRLEFYFLPISTSSFGLFLNEVDAIKNLIKHQLTYFRLDFQMIDRSKFYLHSGKWIQTCFESQNLETLILSMPIPFPQISFTFVCNLKFLHLNIPMFPMCYLPQIWGCCPKLQTLTLHQAPVFSTPVFELLPQFRILEIKLDYPAAPQDISDMFRFFEHYPEVTLERLAGSYLVTVRD